MNCFPGHPIIAFGIPSGPGMFIIAVLVLVLFGARKLPLFSRSLGRSLGEFRRAKEDFEQELRNAGNLNGESHDDDPHDIVNTILYCLLGISVGLLLLSIVSQSPY